MKNFLFFLMFIFLISCSNDDSVVTKDNEIEKKLNADITEEVVDADCLECLDVKTYYEHFEYYKFADKHSGSLVVKNFHEHVGGIFDIESSHLSFTFDLDPITKKVSNVKNFLVKMEPIKTTFVSIEGRYKLNITFKNIVYREASNKFFIEVYYTLSRTVLRDMRDPQSRTTVVYEFVAPIGFDLKKYLDLNTLEPKEYNKTN